MISSRACGLGICRRSHSSRPKNFKVVGAQRWRDPPDSSMSSSDSTLRELLDPERDRKKRVKEGTDSEGSGSGNAKNRFQSGLAGYEVTEEELAVLVHDIEAEQKQDSSCTSWTC